MERTCTNCSYSRLNPCPYLMKVTCGPSHNYVKWAEKKETTSAAPKFESKLDPPSEDIIEETTRETMKKRKKAERPIMQFKVTVFIVLVVLAFLAIFVFKFMRFVSHLFIAFIALGILITIVGGWIRSKKKRHKK